VHVGIDHCSSVVETVRNRKFRAAIDDVIDASLIAATVKVTGKGSTAAEDALISLSINTQLLSPQVLELLAKEKVSWQKLKTLLTSDKVLSRLDAYSDGLKAYFWQVQAEAKTSEKHQHSEEIYRAWHAAP